MTAYVQVFHQKHQAFWVPTPGFDELMLLLSPALAERYDAASVRAAAEQTAQTLEKSRTDACRAARSHDGTHWCPQLDALTKEAEKHHLGHVGRWRIGEWLEYVRSGVSVEERVARCDEAIAKLPDTPWVYSMKALWCSLSSPVSLEIDPLLDRADHILNSQAFGHNSEECLQVLTDRGCIEISRDRPIEAEKIFRTLVARRTLKLGSDHPDTLLSRNNLAIALQDQHKILDAMQEHRGVLDVRQRVYGTEHPDTLISRSNLASVLRRLGLHAEAEKEYRALLAIYQRVFGLEDNKTFETCFNLALSLEDQNKFKEALELMERVEIGWRKMPGGDPLRTKYLKTRVDRIQRKLREQQK
jgi:tetratricopeptide (TPR) repeat protein